MIRTCTLVAVFGECPCSKTFSVAGQDVTSRRSVVVAYEIVGVGQFHVYEVRSVDCDGNRFGLRWRLHVGVFSERMSVTPLLNLGHDGRSGINPHHCVQTRKITKT